MRTYRSPDTPTVAELNRPGGYFNPSYNAKLELAKRDRARARKNEARKVRGAALITYPVEVANALRDKGWTGPTGKKG